MEDQNLKNAGLKVTMPRKRILEILERSDAKHVSVEDIYRKLLEDGGDISLATVYRVLTQFEYAGLVIRHRFSSGTSVFELDQGSHHDHLVCVQCGKILEFTDNVVAKQIENVVKNNGFRAVDYKLILYVSDCKRKACKKINKG